MMHLILQVFFSHREQYLLNLSHMISVYQKITYDCKQQNTKYFSASGVNREQMFQLTWSRF